MNRSKAYLLVSAAIVTAFIFSGCGLIGSWSAKPNAADSITDEIPEWLTIAHRAQVSEQPVTEPDEDISNQGSEEVPSGNQPPAAQPPVNQPAQQAEQQTPPTGKPKWQQPGTMEYIAKLRLDELVFEYKKLNREIADLEAESNKTAEDKAILTEKKKVRESFYKDTLAEIAGGIGLDLEKEYGITPPPAVTSGSSGSTWFHNWDEPPSGYNSQ